MIRVEVASIILVNMGKEYVVLLRGDDDDRSLPISIGQLEAQSIAIQINKVTFPRPLTHDLFKTVMTEFNCNLDHIVIHDLVNETFFANLILKGHGKTITIDCRPSDAIAIALRFSKPMYVEEKIMNEAGIIIPENSSTEESIDSEESITTDDSDLSPLELLKKKLTTAIKDERYEEAAKYRDEIEKFSQTN